MNKKIFKIMIMKLRKTCREKGNEEIKKEEKWFTKNLILYYLKKHLL